MVTNRTEQGWALPPAAAKSIIVAGVLVGVWVGTIQVQMTYKANISDVAKNPVEQTEVSRGLANIARRLDAQQTTLAAMDRRQRGIRDDVVKLKTVHKLDE